MKVCVLAIDTSTEFCSVALLSNNIIFEYFNLMPKEHTKYILTIIDKLLANVNLKFKNINFIAYSCGPGNFTSLRVGASVVQGISLGSELPFINVSTLEVLAEQTWQKTHIDKIISAIYAKREQVYWGQYKKYDYKFWYLKKSESLLSINNIDKNLSKNIRGKWAISGNAWQKYPNMLKDNNKLILIDKRIIFPRAYAILPIALHKIKTDNVNSYKDNVIINYLE